MSIDPGQTSEGVEQASDEAIRIIVEGPVQEILIDGFSGALWQNDVVQLNLYRDRLAPNSGESNERVLIARLSMGVSALVSFHEGLAELVEELQKQVLSPAAVEQEETKEQDDLVVG